MDSVENMLKAFQIGKWEEGESSWLTALDKGIKTLAPLRTALRELWRRGKRELAIELIEFTIANYAEADQLDLWLESLRLMAEYKPRRKGLVVEYTTAFQKKHANHPYLSDWIPKVNCKNLPIFQFIKTLDKLILFREGIVVKHHSGWGLGTVMEIRHEQMDMIVNLERRPNHRMNILAAADCLTPLPDDNFESLLIKNPQYLRQEAADNPVQLIHRVLKFTEEPTSARDLKLHLCPNIVTDKQWSKWWTRTRKLLIADPYVETGSQTHSKYHLREEAVFWEDEIRLAFERAQPEEQPAIVYDYLKNSTEKQHLDYFAQKMAQLGCQNAHSWNACEAYLVLQQCVRQGAQPPDQEPVARDIFSGNGVAIFKNLRIGKLTQQALETFMENNLQWEQYVIAIFREGTDFTRDTLLRTLSKKKAWEKHVSAILQDSMDNRLHFPDSFIWFGRQIINKRLKNQKGMPDLLEVFQELLQSGTMWKSLGKSEATDKLQKLFSMPLVDKILEKITSEHAMQIFHTVKTSSWLPYNFRETMQLSIRERFPDLFKKVEYIYTTAEGLEKYEAELQELLQVKIPENAKAIGRALGFGDISENAELDAARELQWQLVKKAQTMQNNLARAKVINFANVDTNRVSAGTKVTIANENGQQQQYTLLGPWDVELDKGIISFMSPIAQSLVGATIGKTVNLPSGPHTVMAIDRYCG